MSPLTLLLLPNECAVCCASPAPRAVVLRMFALDLVLVLVLSLPDYRIEGAQGGISHPVGVRVGGDAALRQRPRVQRRGVPSSPSMLFFSDLLLFFIYLLLLFFILFFFLGLLLSRSIFSPRARVLHHFELTSPVLRFCLCVLRRPFFCLSSCCFVFLFLLFTLFFCVCPQFANS